MTPEIENAFAAIRGEHVEVLFDLPRPEVWRGHEGEGITE